MVLCEKSLHQATAEILFEFLIFLFGSLFNLAILWTFTKSRKLRSNNTLFLYSLSVAGLVFALISSPLSAIISYNWFQKTCARDLAHANRVIYHTAFFASICTLTMMSMERSYVICNPLKYKLKITENKALVAIGATWLVAFSVGLTEAVKILEGYVKSVILIGAVVTCYVIIILCYIVMFGVIRKQRKIHHEYGSRRKTLVNNIRRKTERELAKTIGLIVGVFAFTWSPIAYTLAVTPNLDKTSGDGLILHWSLAVGMASSVFNPLIYFFRSREFRKAASELICCSGSLQCYLFKRKNSLRSLEVSTIVGRSMRSAQPSRASCINLDNHRVVSEHCLSTKPAIQNGLSAGIK